jgi:hypothetical protein
MCLISLLPGFLQGRCQGGALETSHIRAFFAEGSLVRSFLRRRVRLRFRLVFQNPDDLRRRGRVFSCAEGYLVGFDLVRG